MICAVTTACTRTPNRANARSVAREAGRYAPKGKRMKVHLLIVGILLAGCGGAGTKSSDTTTENDVPSYSAPSQNTTLNLGDRKLVVDLPGWKIVQQTPEVTSLMSQENEVVSILVVEKENSSLEQTCPIMFGNISSDQVPFIAEQKFQSSRYSGLVRGYYGNVPSLGGKVIFLYYCLQTNNTFLKLDFMVSPQTYERKQQFYSAAVDQFVLY